MRDVILSLFGPYTPIMLDGQAFVDWSYIASVGLFAFALWGLLIIVRSVISKL